MATKRFGYLDDLSLKNQKVGIGTSTANEKLEVLGGTRGGDVVVTGIATLTSYQGFQNQNTSFTDNVLIGGGESGTLSGEIVIGAGLTMSVGTGATTGQGSIKSLKVSNTFTPPIGGINDRPSAPQPGAIFYNKDFRTIEYWDGKFWRQVDNTTRRGRGVWGGGYAPALSQVMDYVNIPTQGNAINFGQLNVGGASKGSMGSNGTRGLFMGGYWPAAPTVTNQIDYITIPSAGNGIDFGDLTESKWGPQGASSSTRGIRMGGFGATDVIDYVEISTVGNAIDFGNLTTTKMSMGVCSSPVKVFGGGGNQSSNNYSTIEMITTASKGNALDDGDLIQANWGVSSASNSTRGLWAGGADNVSIFNDIQYRNLSSSGTAQYFGELTTTSYKKAGAATQTRAVFGGGQTASPNLVINTIDYVTIATAGNAADFGDLTQSRRNLAAVSDSHGGLGGY